MSDLGEEQGLVPDAKGNGYAVNHSHQKEGPGGGVDKVSICSLTRCILMEERTMLVIQMSKILPHILFF